MWRRVTFAWCVMLLAAEAGWCREIEPLQVGNWTGGAYTDDKSGQFSHCVVGVNYQGPQKALHFSVTRDWTWLIGIQNATWKFSNGDHVPVLITFDRIGPYQLDGIAMGGNFVKATLPNDKVAIEAFRAALYLHVKILSVTQGYSLESSSALIPALANCVSAHLRAEQSAAAVAQPVSPPQNPSPSKSEAEVARDKVLGEAGKAYSDCFYDQLLKLVPYSNESADIIAQAVITNCTPLEQRFIELSMATSGFSRTDVEKIVGPEFEKRKNGLIAQIVTLRAELNKFSSQQNTQEPAAKDAKGQGL